MTIWLTAMHVVARVPITAESLAEQNKVRCPGSWDVISHIDNANAFDPSAVNVERLREAESLDLPEHRRRAFVQLD